MFCRELPGGSFLVKVSRSVRGLIPHLQVDRSLAKPKRGDLLTCKVAFIVHLNDHFPRVLVSL